MLPGHNLSHPICAAGGRCASAYYPPAPVEGGTRSCPRPFGCSRFDPCWPYSELIERGWHKVLGCSVVYGMHCPYLEVGGKRRGVGVNNACGALLWHIMLNVPNISCIINIVNKQAKVVRNDWDQCFGPSVSKDGYVYSPSFCL